MAILIKRKLEGSTLIEVIIAMVIIMVVFVIAMKVFANVFKTGVSFKNIQVSNQLNILCKKVQTSGYIDNNRVKIDSVDYELIEKESEVKSVSFLEIRASQKGRSMGTIKTLFKVKPYAKN